MNPALYDYLRNQQNQSAQNPAPQETYNPFNSGIRNAIQSARQSLEMTDKQQDKALRRSMLAFAEHMGNEPRQKGFLANFGAAARSLAPALTAYDEDESAALAENNAFANQLLAHQAAEQQRQAQEEQRDWQRDFAERQLGESVRSHNLLDRFRRDKLGLEQAANNPGVSVPESLSALGDDLIPIESKAERLMYTKDRKATGEILSELNSIKSDYEKFRELTKDHLIDPMAPYGIGKTGNKVKDLWGYVADNPNLKKTTKERSALDAKLRKFSAEIERKLKGGVLSMGMIKMFEDKNILPSLENDRPEIFEQKIDNLIEEISAHNKASTASLKHGVHLNSYDLARLSALKEEGQSNLPRQPSQTNQVQKVKMRAPDGSEAWVLPEKVAQKEALGLVVVNE